MKKAIRFVMILGMVLALFGAVFSQDDDNDNDDSDNGTDTTVTNDNTVTDPTIVDVTGPPTQFVVTIENVSGENGFATGISPGVFVATSEVAPLFTIGQLDRGLGLEALAEDGNPCVLVSNIQLQAADGITPFSFGVFDIPQTSMDDMDIMDDNMDMMDDNMDMMDDNMDMMDDNMDMMMGDEYIGLCADNVATDIDMDMSMDNVDNVNDDMDMMQTARPAFPGESYTFTFEATPGETLTFITMYGETNDQFIAPNELGIPLFNTDGTPISEDVTDDLFVINAGTEFDEPVGQGVNQAPRQSASNIGDDEDEIISTVVGTSPEEPVADASLLVRVTIRPADSMDMMDDDMDMDMDDNMDEDDNS